MHPGRRRGHRPAPEGSGSWRLLPACSRWNQEVAVIREGNRRDIVKRRRNSSQARLKRSALTVQGTKAPELSALKCSSCYAPLQASDNLGRPTPSGGFRVLVCGYCGTSTRIDDARSWATEVNQWLERRFGTLGTAAPTGGADVALRTYVFQRDVVDHLAQRFLNTARFLNPVLSSPDAPLGPTIRDEMEYGLQVDEYLQGLVADASLVDNQEIRSLAGTPVDLQEASSQARKLRSLAYFAQGLIELNHAAETTLSGAAAPAPARQVETAEVYFEGAAKACSEGRQAFPEDPFYSAFGSFASGATHFARAVRFHGLGYRFEPELAEAYAAFENVDWEQPLKLDRSRRAAVFADPSKTKLTVAVEGRFAQAAADNAKRVARYRDESMAFPARVGEVAETVRQLALAFLRSKTTSFRLGLGVIASLLAIVVEIAYGIQAAGGLLRVLGQGGWIPLVAFFVTAVVLGGLMGKQSERRQLILASYGSLATGVARVLHMRIYLLTCNAPSVVEFYTRPWVKLHQLFLGRIASLGWYVAKGEVHALTDQLSSIPPMPAPLALPAPSGLATPKRSRPDPEYQGNPALEYGWPAFGNPLEARVVRV